MRAAGSSNVEGLAAVSQRISRTGGIPHPGLFERREYLLAHDTSRCEAVIVERQLRRSAELPVCRQEPCETFFRGAQVGVGDRQPSVDEPPLRRGLSPDADALLVAVDPRGSSESTITSETLDHFVTAFSSMIFPLSL